MLFSTGGSYGCHAKLIRVIGEEHCSHIFSGLTRYEIRFGVGGSCDVIDSLFFCFFLLLR